ncbi:MAG: hypothetical protein IPJ32_10420 [Sphingobacteriaceae bacterium]|nr:hypothetical protein [Sphingobacteriaceae bacterium]
MKKSVYIAGISCAILILFGCIFKIILAGSQHDDYFFSDFVLLLVLPSGLMNSYESMPVKK